MKCIDALDLLMNTACHCLSAIVTALTIRFVFFIFTGA